MDFQTLSHDKYLESITLGHGMQFSLYIVGLYLLIFCWGDLQLCSREILICTFVFLYCHCLALVKGCCCCSFAQSCPTLCNPMNCSTPGLPVPHHLPDLPKFMFIASVMQSSCLILWSKLLLLSSIFPSIKDFSSECLVTSDDQNTGVSASAPVLPVNIQGWWFILIFGKTNTIM